MDWKNVVGDAATVSTVCLFLTGIPICRKIWENRSTIGTSSLPFLTAFVSCSLWLCYGVMKDDFQIKLVNAFGLIVQILYIGFYVHMSTAKAGIRNKIIATFATPVALVVCLKTNAGDDDAMFTRNLGFLACIASLVFFSSPLANIVSVIRTQNASSMPLPLIFLSCIQSLLWFFYGILTDDVFVQIPNLLSATITALQLFLFVLFTGSSKDTLLDHGKE